MAKVITEKQITKNLVSPDSEGVFYTNAATQESFASTEKVSTSGKTVTATTTFNAASTGKAKAANVVNLEGFANVEIDDRYVSSVIGGTHKITETVKTTYSDKELSEVASTTTTKQESSNATGAAKLTGGTYKIDSLADANGVVTPETAVTYDNLTLKDATAYNAAGAIYGGRSSVKTTETVTGASTSTTSSKTYTASGAATFENAKIVAENLDAGEEAPGVLYGYKKVTVTGTPAGANAVSVGRINSINTTRSSKVESSFVEDATFAYAEAGKIANTSSATVKVTDATVGEIAGASTLTLDGATAGTLNSETFTTTAAESIVAVQTGDAASAVTYKNTETTRSQPSGRLTATGSTIGEMAFSQRIVKLDDTVANGFSDSGSSTVKTTRNVSWTADESVQNDADAYRDAAEEIEVGSENMTSYLVEESSSVTHSGSLTASFSIADDANAIGAVDGYRTVKLENVGGETDAGATVYGADNGKVSASTKRTQSASGRSSTVKNSGSKYADGRLEATGSNITVGDAEQEAYLSSIKLTDTTVDGFSARGLKATSSTTVSESVTFAKDEDGAYDKSLTAAKATFSATTSHKVTSNGKFEMTGGAITGDATLKGYKTIALEGVDMGDATFVDNNGLSNKNVLKSQNVAVTALTGDTDLIADSEAGVTLFGNVKGSFTQQGEQVSANWSASYAKKTGGSYSQTAVYDVDAGEVKGANAGTISDYAKVALKNVSAVAVKNNTLDVKQTVKYATKVTKDGAETTTDINTTTATYTAVGKLTAASTFLGGTLETKSIETIAGVKDVVLENVSLTGGAKLNGNVGVDENGEFVENDDGRNVTVVTDAVLGDETVAYTTDGSFKASNTAAWIASGATLAEIGGDVKGFKKVTLENIDAKSVTGGNDDLYAAGTFKATSITGDNTIDGEISGYKSVTIDGYTVTGDITATFETGKTYGTAEISNATLGGSLVSGYSFVSFKNVTSDVVSVINEGQGGTGSYFDAGSKDNRVAAYGLIRSFETVSLYATVTGTGDARNYSQTIGTIYATNAALAVEVVDKTLATDVSQSINALFANAVVITSASKVRTDESGAALDNCGSVTINNLVAYSQTKALTVQADIATTISALIGSKADDTLTFNATGILNLDKAGFGEGTDRIVLNLGEEETFNLVGDTVFADYKELAAKIKSTGLEAFAGTGKVVISNIAASETFDKDLKAALDAAGVAYSAGIKFESAVAAVPKMETIGSTVQTINGYEVRDFIQIAKKGSDCLNSDITLKGGDDTLSFSDDLEWRITGRTTGLDFGAGVDRVSTYTFTQGAKDAKGNYPEPVATTVNTVSLTNAKTFANSTLYIDSSDALENEFYVSNVEKYDGQFKFKTDADRTLKVATDTTMQTEGNAKGEIDNTVNAGKEVTATSLVFDSNAAEVGLAKGEILEAKGFTSVQFKELDGVSGLGANAGRVAVYSAKNDSAINSATRTFEKVAEFDVPVQSADVTNLMSVSQTFTGSVTDGSLKIKATAADAEFTVSETSQPTNIISTLTNGTITADSKQGSTRFVVVDFNGSGAQGIGEQVKGDIASASRIADGTTMVQTVKALNATNTFTYTGILMKTEADAEATNQTIVATGATAAADDLFTSEAITLTKGTISNLEAGNVNLKTIKTDKVQTGTNVTTTAANKIVAANLNETMGLEVTVTDGNEFAIAGAGAVSSKEQEGVSVSTSDWDLNDGFVKATINADNKVTISSGSKGTALFEKVQEVTFVANDKVAIVDDKAKAEAVDFSASGAEAKTAYVKTNNFEITGDAKAQYGEDMGATVSGDGVKAMIDGKSVTLNANSAAATLTDAMSVEFIKGSGDKVILDTAGNVTTSKVDDKTAYLGFAQGFTLGKEAIAQYGDVVVKNVDQTLTSGVHAMIRGLTVTLQYGSEAADLTAVGSVEFIVNTDDRVTLTDGAANVTTSKVDDKTVYLGEKSFEITKEAVAAYATGSATAAGDGLAGKFKVYDTDKQSFVWAENGDKKYAAGTFTNLEKIVFHEPEEEHLFEGSIEAKSVNSVDALAADGTTTVKTTGLKAVNYTFPGKGDALSTIENKAEIAQTITLTNANGNIVNSWYDGAKTSTVKGTDYVNAKLSINVSGSEYVKNFTQGTIEVTAGENLYSVAFNDGTDKVTGNIWGAAAATKTAMVVEDDAFEVTGQAKAASGAGETSITVSNVEGAAATDVVKAKITDATGRVVEIADKSAAAALTYTTKVVFDDTESRYLEIVVPESVTNWNGWTITTSAFTAGTTPTVTVENLEKLKEEYPSVTFKVEGVETNVGNIKYTPHNTGTYPAGETLIVTGPDTALSSKPSYVDGISGADKVEFTTSDRETTYGSVTLTSKATKENPVQTADYKNEKTLVVGSDYAFTITQDKTTTEAKEIVGAAYSVDDRKIVGDHKTNAIRATGDGVKGQFTDKESITLLKDSAAATITDVKVVAFGSDGDKVTFNAKQDSVTTSAYADKTVIADGVKVTLAGAAKTRNSSGAVTVSGDEVAVTINALGALLADDGTKSATVVTTEVSTIGFGGGWVDQVTLYSAGTFKTAADKTVGVGAYTDQFKLFGDVKVANDEATVSGDEVKASLNGTTLVLDNASSEATVEGVTAVSVNGFSMVENAKGLTKAGLTGAMVAADKSFEIKDATYEVTQNGTAKVKGNGVKASLNGATLTLDSGMGVTAQAALTKITQVNVGDKTAISSTADDALLGAAKDQALVADGKSFTIGTVAGYTVGNGTATVKGEGVTGKFTDADSFTLSNEKTAALTGVADVTISGQGTVAATGISSATKGVAPAQNSVTASNLAGVSTTGYTGKVKDANGNEIAFDTATATLGEPTAIASLTAGSVSGTFLSVNFGEDGDKGTLAGAIDLAAFDAVNSKATAKFSSLTSAFTGVDGVAYDFTATAKLTQNVTFNDGNDKFTFEAASKPLGTSTLDMGAGDDELSLSAGSTIENMANLDFGDGDDTLNLGGSTMFSQHYDTMDDFVSAFQNMSLEQLEATKAVKVYVDINDLHSDQLKGKLRSVRENCARRFLRLVA